MATLPIFPSLSRAPSMDDSEQAEDDTIRDQMELGYTAGRPRFTRSRRSWNCNVRNLLAEDVRALKNFRDTLVLRGSMPFRYPNLLSNGSFEMQAAQSSSDLAMCWAAGGSAVAAALSQTALDGSASLSLTATAAMLGGVIHDRQFPVRAGDLYAFSAQVNVLSGTASMSEVANVVRYENTPAQVGSGPVTYLMILWLAANAYVPPGTTVAIAGTGNAIMDGRSFTAVAQDARWDVASVGQSLSTLVLPWGPGTFGPLAVNGTASYSAVPCAVITLAITYDDLTTAEVYAVLQLPPAGQGWQLVGGTLGIPPSVGGSVIGVASFSLQIASVGPLQVLFDCAGVALAAAGKPATQMVGSEPIASVVRFAENGLPKFSSLGWIGGVKRYGTTFGMTEV